MPDTVPNDIRAALTQELKDVLKLPPTPTAWALVGMYLGFFSSLESAIDQTLVDVVGMGSVPFLALNRNLDLRAKVNVLRTLADMVYLGARDTSDTRASLAERRDATSTALKELIRPHIEERNMVAHSPFSYAWRPQ